MSDFIEGVSRKVPDNSDVLSELLDSMNDMLKNFSTMSENMNKTYSQATGKISNTYVRSGKYTHTPFSEEQKEILKHFESQIRTLNAYVQTATDQIDKTFKDNAKAIEYFTKYLKDDKVFKSNMKDIQKQYAKDFVKYQDKNLLPSIGDAFLKESPLLRRIFGKITPGEEGTAQAQRAKERAGIKSGYLGLGESEFEQSKRRFVLGTGESENVRNAEMASKGLERDLASRKRQYAFENLGVNFTMPDGMGGFGPTGQKPSDMFKESSNKSEDAPAKSDPSKGDLMKLSGKWVNGSIYVGNTMEAGFTKILKKMDDSNFSSMLENQKGLLEKIGLGGGVLASLTALLPALLPILGILAGGAALTALGIAVNKLISDEKKDTIKAYTDKGYTPEAAEREYNLGTMNATLEGGAYTPPSVEDILSPAEKRAEMTEFEKSYEYSSKWTNIKRKKDKDDDAKKLFNKITEIKNDTGEKEYNIIWKLYDDPSYSSILDKYHTGGVVRPSYVSPRFLTGNYVGGNSNEEVDAKLLAGEVVLSPQEAKEYANFKKELDTSTKDIPIKSELSNTEVLSKISELVELNRSLLEEMKLNTKTLDKKEFTKEDNGIRATPSTKMTIASY